MDITFKFIFFRLDIKIKKITRKKGVYILYQLVSIIVSFLIIPAFIRMKIKLNYALFIVIGILSMLTGLRFKALVNIALSVFINSTSLATILTVIMVGILGGLMRQYKFFDNIAKALLHIIRNKRNILMIIPAMMGLLIIPGGALLSAPFVNNIGNEIGVPPSRRAAINVVFRHIALFLLPYSTSLLMVIASVPNISIFRLISLNLFFVTSVVIIGYIYLIRDISFKIESLRINIAKDFKNLLIYTSPIYICVLVNSLFGIPFYIALTVSVFIIYIFSNKKSFFINLLKSFNYNIVITVISILIIKEIILNMKDLLKVLSEILSLNNSILSTMLIFWLLSFFLGFITGNQTAALAIVLPIVSQLYDINDIFYIYISYFWNYLYGLFSFTYSPLPSIYTRAYEC